MTKTSKVIFTHQPHSTHLEIHRSSIVLTRVHVETDVKERLTDENGVGIRRERKRGTVCAGVA